jgi:hypothetical protein
MEGKMNLWQRCEALGPMEDQGVALAKHKGVWIMYIDGQQVFFAYEDGTINDICRAWLADAILQRFEAITKQGGTVLTTSNVVKEVERMYNETVHSFSGGPKEWRERFMADETDGRHNEPNWEGCPPGSVPVAIPQPTPNTVTQEMLLALAKYIESMDQHRQAVIGIKIIGKTLAAIEANAMHVGEIAVFDLANMVGIGSKQQALMFRMRVESGKVTEFTSDMEWNSILKRIGIDVPELPTPKILPEPTYIVESPKEFVSIPLAEWQQLRQSLTAMQAILFSEVQPVEFES